MFRNFRNKINEMKEIAESFGGVYRGNDKYIFRKNVGEGDTYPENGAYFGIINLGEENSGPYSDLSVVVFPSNEENDEDDRWIISLGVGSLGYREDYDIASRPGTRRLFINLLKDKSFIKNDFLDIETKDGFGAFCIREEVPETLLLGIKNYYKVLLSSTIVNPNNSDEYSKTLKTYIALYAKLRSWPSNNAQRTAVNQIINKGNSDVIDCESEIKDLLETRKYIVIQGAPGTGKTRIAKRLATDGKVFFTQFHAETSYSDFVYGIVPNLDKGTPDVKYKEKKGVFVKAIEAAKNEKVYLIIDEINRANLSNVLGPAFYLFEPKMEASEVKIEICPGIEIDKLPDNLHVIATMNTADRSLSVIDYALRRRFAWYTLRPQEIKIDEATGKCFCSREFNEIKNIFEQYASDDELDLMPGHAYFIVNKNEKDSEIVERLKYEVMPLIKEYLTDGMLMRAKDDFVNYFRERINEEMFR